MKKYKIRPLEWTCDLCQCVLTSVAMAEDHFDGAAHHKRLSALYQPLEPSA